MRITKIKLTKEKRISIAYESKNSHGTFDEFSLCSVEVPLPSLISTIERLKPFVLEMCELPEEDLENIIVKGVSFSYGGENNTMGATIVAQKVLMHSNVPLNMNTPHKTIEHYSGSEDGDKKQLLTRKCVSALEDLQVECQKYVNGERSQMNLFKFETKPVEKPEQVAVAT